MSNVRKRLEKRRMQKLSPGAGIDSIIDKYSTRGIGGAERSIMPVLVKTSSSKSELSNYVRHRCLKSSSFIMTTKPDGIDRAPKTERVPLVIWNDEVERKPSPPAYKKMLEKIVREGEEEEKKKGKVA